MKNKFPKKSAHAPGGQAVNNTGRSRRDFLRRGALIAGGLVFASCENLVAPVVNSPGRLAVYGAPKKIIMVGAGMAGLVAGFELTRAGHDVMILEARPRIGGRVLTLREPFSDGHFAEAGAARIPPDHHLTLGYAEYFGLTLDPFYARSGQFVNMSGGVRRLIPAAAYLNSPPWPGSVNRGHMSKSGVGPITFPGPSRGRWKPSSICRPPSNRSGSGSATSSSGRPAGWNMPPTGCSAPSRCRC